MKIQLNKITEIIQAKCIINTENCEIEHVSIDSRSLQNGKQTLFFALIGSNNDGHDYVEDLISKGIKNFVVTKISKELSTKANFLITSNTLKALQDFAGYYRALFEIPVLGITGSNGKTIVKEWLYFLLNSDYKIVKSPKSYNSQVGVSLSVIGINEKHNLGIFEAGISTVSEMENLQKIIKPKIGILTNIGIAHDEGFENKAQKLREKFNLFKDSEVIIYPKNDLIDSCYNEFSEHVKIKNRTNFTWSYTDETAHVFILDKQYENENTIIYYRYNEHENNIKIPFNDEASIENAITCLMVMLLFNYEFKVIRNRMLMLFPVRMRLEVKNGINNCNIIEDNYGSDFQSLKIALDFLESQKQNSKKTVILSDIFQSGFSNKELYSQVAQFVLDNKISRVISIGKIISSHKNKFINCVTYNNTSEFIADFENYDFSDETILVKGARGFGFEEIVSLLEEKTHETILEIDLNAISHNLNFFKSKLANNVKIMVMVKAFGYGNGGLEIVRLLEYHNVDYLGVAFTDEGISLKQGGVKLPIMVLNPESTSFPSIIQYELEPEIYSLKGLKAFLKIAKEKNLKDFPIHIKFDTGMHRLGFEENTLQELITNLKGNSSVKVKSILSHMATSDDKKQYDFAIFQINLFEKLSNELMNSLGINPIRHILNTSGISNFPESQYNMVRLGIGLYGVSNDILEQKYLENVGTLKSIISQVRTIPAGNSVGYSRRFVAKKTTKVATIPIGYADGISRLWGNGVGHVVINGKKATIIGSVCMDMIMVDVTDVDCVEGDTVIIFGESPTVTEIANALHTIPYEVLTSISQRVKRIFFR